MHGDNLDVVTTKFTGHLIVYNAGLPWWRSG